MLVTPSTAILPVPAPAASDDHACAPGDSAFSKLLKSSQPAKQALAQSQESSAGAGNRAGPDAAAQHAAEKHPAAQHAAAQGKAQAAQRTNAKSAEAPPCRTARALEPAAPQLETKVVNAADEAAAQDPQALDPALADWLSSLQLPAPALPDAVPPQEATPIASALQNPAADATAITASVLTHAPLATAPSALKVAAASVDTVGPAEVRLPGLAVDAKPAAPQGTVANAKASVERDDKPDHAARTAAMFGPNSPVAIAAASEWQGTHANQGQQARAVDAVTALATPAGQTAPATLAAVRDMAQPLPLSVATPVAAPEFPHALGVQLSVLAQAGVQHAELQLNPAEMGPVSVHIAMDGSAARIEFGADVAATRQAIESGLPELASALREAGLTLSGGGVSQHARGRGDNGHASQRDGRGRHSTIAENATPTTRRMVTVGGVDLYA